MDFHLALDNYLNRLIACVPDYIFHMLLSILSTGTVVAIVVYGGRKGLIFSARILLITYVYIIFCATVIYRNTRNIVEYNYHPFWSYGAIGDGKLQLLEENIMNIIVFIPIGLLIGVSFSKLMWWKTIGIGCLFSFMIEAMQLILKRGFSEIDDVIHNTLGCAIGYGISQLIMIVYSAIVRHNICAKYRK